tara:strand:+ start:59 stop:436 length:378 start_codon:yes stop_codon:yes gene_type:complete
LICDSLVRPLFFAENELFIMNINDLPNDILGMIYDIKEDTEHLDKIEEYARSNFKFVMKDIKQRFENILDDRQDEVVENQILVSDITEDQYLTEDALTTDSQFNFVNMTAYISDAYLYFKKKHNY